MGTLSWLCMTVEIIYLYFQDDDLFPVRTSILSERLHQTDACETSFLTIKSSVKIVPPISILKFSQHADFKLWLIYLTHQVSCKNFKALHKERILLQSSSNYYIYFMEIWENACIINCFLSHSSLSLWTLNKSRLIMKLIGLVSFMAVFFHHFSNIFKFWHQSSINTGFPCLNQWHSSGYINMCSDDQLIGVTYIVVLAYCFKKNIFGVGCISIYSNSECTALDVYRFFPPRPWTLTFSLWVQNIARNFIS